MRYIIFIVLTMQMSLPVLGQDSFLLKGIAIDKSGTPVSFCKVSIKGKNISAVTNECGEFSIHPNQSEFTLVFNCSSTHDFVTFERIISNKDILGKDTILFQLKEHSGIENNNCNKTINKGFKKIKL